MGEPDHRSPGGIAHGNRRKRRRRRSQGPRSEGHRRRLRLVYFGLASVWGYVTGTAAILGGLAWLDRALPLGPRTGALLIGAGLLAVVGGAVAAAAYQDAADRRGE